jgi:hypothetical protein
MKNFAFWLVTVFVLLFSSLSSAQTLWRGTKYGMSVQQVRTIVPEAAPPSEPDRLHNGAQELLRVESFELVNEKFSGGFYFLSGKLTQVTLSLARGNNYSTGLTAFNKLVEALRSKYGKEDNRKGSDDLFMKSMNAQWLSGRTNIELTLISTSEDRATLNVAYQVRVGKEAEKL